MKIYKLIKNPMTGDVNSIQRLSDNAFIPFDPANTDYQQFKQAISDGKAELQDAEGNLLTPLEAKTYIATLP